MTVDLSVTRYRKKKLPSVGCRRITYAAAIRNAKLGDERKS
jgi:hypothetical protein